MSSDIIVPPRGKELRYPSLMVPRYNGLSPRDISSELHHNLTPRVKKGTSMYKWSPRDTFANNPPPPTPPAPPPPPPPPPTPPPHRHHAAADSTNTTGQPRKAYSKPVTTDDH